jgi:glycine cleavage system transcriptional repressor
VVAAVGTDQPGIIAALTGAIFKLGGNLDDATMTRLHGAFAAMVSARLPEGRTANDVRDALAPVAGELDLAVTVQPVEDIYSAAPADFLITVYGADKPGIVHTVTSRLAACGVNITDLDTRMAGTEETPVYVMLIEVAAGTCELLPMLTALGHELNVNITSHPLDSEAL